MDNSYKIAINGNTRNVTMSYEEIAKVCEQLSYRDKFRLAQLLLQLGRKQEEDEYPAPRITSESNGHDQTDYVTERLLKLKPSKLTSLSNSISAMFQFQGGISEKDKQDIIAKLKQKNVIHISDTGKVSYSQ
ncbi:hypothetical protein ACTG23_22800 [Aeromonas enteropelogenes]|uniref:hypothetical protein n=1 Tax=Aeromonas enteropelogenes TaxID=29489 RepID=UPI003F7AC377